MLNFTTQSPPSRIKPDDRSTNAHRQLIGYIGLLLPFLLIAPAMCRDGLEKWRNLDSVSAYYYTGAAAVFVGMLVSLALFLLTYRGFMNAQGKLDRRAAIFAGVMLLAVAFWPTHVPRLYADLTWWRGYMLYIHQGAACLVFLTFAYFALWLFPLDADGKRHFRKSRDKVYLASGLVIVLAIVWALVNGLLLNTEIFWPEMAALIAFSVSWLAKGRAESGFLK
ncbi:MAG TPA: hypothetical protein VFB08_02095 [Burkholderiales bacterium]|nr:hypothetical protein [Burkholderiales bacterium]